MKFINKAIAFFLVLALGTITMSWVLYTPEPEYPTRTYYNSIEEAFEAIDDGSDARINIRYTVELVPQQTSVSCWAAGAAMLVGWRDQVCIDPSEIARGIGYWRQYRDPVTGGLPPDDTNMFRYWGLTPATPMTYTTQGFADLLNTKGPLWTAGWAPGAHIRVVAGMRGDGTPDGTLVVVYDPWERGMTRFRSNNRGSIYTETYTAYVRQQEALSARESNIAGAIYVVHN